MRKQYLSFNFVCLIISGLFALGILWLWKGYFVNFENKKEVVPAVSYKTILDNKKIKVEDATVIEDKNIETEKTEAENVLPKEFNLAVPFTSQAPEKDWSQPWQDACEEAAILMLDAYYKNYNLSPLFAKDEILKMVSWEEEQGWGGSIEIEKVQKLLAHYGGNAKSRIIENPTIEEIKKLVSSGNPVLVVADGKVLPNPHFQNGGPVYHALIIRGYTQDSFITNDPGTQFGESFLYKYNDLMNSIRDWNSGDVKNGRVVVLAAD